MVSDQSGTVNLNWGENPSCHRTFIALISHNCILLLTRIAPSSSPNRELPTTTIAMVKSRQLGVQPPCMMTQHRMMHVRTHKHVHDAACMHDDDLLVLYMHDDDLPIFSFSSFTCMVVKYIGNKARNGLSSLKA
jgi:hypothetical protein